MNPDITIVYDYLCKVANIIVSRSDLEISESICKDDIAHVILKASNITVWLLYEIKELSIEMETTLSGATYYPWAVLETTTAEEGANMVLDYYDLYCKKVKLLGLLED
jgi:hypothetical protein